MQQNIACIKSIESYELELAEKQHYTMYSLTDGLLVKEHPI